MAETGVLETASGGLHFSKMHGLGNDFMVLDLISQDARLDSATIQQLANRHTGIGFDQLLTVEPPSDPDCDFLFRIYNADGSQAEHCGNGARCLTRFILDRGLSYSKTLRLQLAKTQLEATLLDDGLIGINMGPPELRPAHIPFAATAQSSRYTLSVDSEQLDITALSMGNPHAVLLVDDVDSAPVAELGPQIEAHQRFPQRVNVGFLQVLDPQHVKLRVYERGAGETMACGTGACAAVVAGRLRELLAERVSVELIGGTLHIEWAGGDNPVIMTGPATTVYHGQLTL